VTSVGVQAVVEVSTQTAQHCEQHSSDIADRATDSEDPESVKQGRSSRDGSLCRQDHRREQLQSRLSDYDSEEKKTKRQLTKSTDKVEAYIDSKLLVNRPQSGKNVAGEHAQQKLAVAKSKTKHGAVREGQCAVKVKSRSNSVERDTVTSEDTKHSSRNVKNRHDKETKEVKSQRKGSGNVPTVSAVSEGQGRPKVKDSGRSRDKAHQSASGRQHQPHQSTSSPIRAAIGAVVEQQLFSVSSSADSMVSLSSLSSVTSVSMLSPTSHLALPPPPQQQQQLLTPGFSCTTTVAASQDDHSTGKKCEHLTTDAAY
jgi:hypothetical protein